MTARPNLIAAAIMNINNSQPTSIPPSLTPITAGDTNHGGWSESQQMSKKGGKRYNMRKKWYNFKQKITSTTETTHTTTKINTMPQCARSGHACCTIDDESSNRMIIVGGYDANGKRLSSGIIYNATTHQCTPLPHKMPVALYGCTATCGGGNYMYVIGGLGGVNDAIANTVYRLSLMNYKWKNMSAAPMKTARFGHASVLCDNYIYVFGGLDHRGKLASVERYSISKNTWEDDLPAMDEARVGHCAVVVGNLIYIVGGYRAKRSMIVFDTVSLKWRSHDDDTDDDGCPLSDMPYTRDFATAVVLRDDVLPNVVNYLMIIGGEDEHGHVMPSCLIYNCYNNTWSSVPVCMEMTRARSYHVTSVLKDRVIVAGGIGSNDQRLSSMESIQASDLLRYAPLMFPLPTVYFDQILLLGKAKDDNGDET
uniref:Uncharacterized protein n=2 Tax=Leptocylindrus danicus TaxID=163516 RepID=A0A7S2L769_9STRA|mmetsp:Transcript_32735/g.47370  ORF Transcript_32735/g.47370 Transcript_32735/m.47370 type:complete len:424 (+) Transcript_32735:3-1274(+)